MSTNATPTLPWLFSKLKGVVKIKTGLVTHTLNNEHVKSSVGRNKNCVVQAVLLKCDIDVLLSLYPSTQQYALATKETNKAYKASTGNMQQSICRKYATSRQV